MTINSNHSFLAFQKEIENVRNWLKKRAVPVLGYPSEILLDRLTQRVIEIGLASYARAVLRLIKSGRESFPAPGSRIECASATIETGTGKVELTYRQQILNQVHFVGHWLICFLAILYPKRGRTGASSATLVFGVVESSLFVNGSDEQFVQFCRKGAISPLRGAERLYIQANLPEGVRTCKEFIYCERPLVVFLREAKIGLIGRLGLAIEHALLFLKYASYALRQPEISLLGREIAYAAVAACMDKRQLLGAIILTTANYNCQPLWMRNLKHSKIHLVWYAQNFRPIVYSMDGVESEIPSARWMRVDVHWVWTHAFADYLKGLGCCGEIFVVGSIVWYLPEIRPPERFKVNVAVFDVWPFSNEMALSGGGWVTNYWCPENAHKFLQDIVSLRDKLQKIFQLPVELHLKTKRGYVAGHDKNYFDEISQLEENGILMVEHHTSNMYALISSCHLVIGYPFTSPIYIAEELKVRSIYYDPTGTILPNHFGDSRRWIDFAGSPEALVEKSVLALEGLS